MNSFGRTGSRVSGVTLQRSSHVTYAFPNVPSGSKANFCISTVRVLIRGRSFNILRPSGLASIRSLRAGSTGPDVRSATAATMSWQMEVSLRYRIARHTETYLRAPGAPKTCKTSLRT